MRYFVVASIVAGAMSAQAQQPDARPTGHSTLGLPVFNYDADEGYGYGAQLQYYEYGDGRAQPYRFSLQPTVFLTTRGRRDVTLFLDAPHMLPSHWRMGAQLAREEQKTAPYYGAGNGTIALDITDKSPNPYFYRFSRTVLRANADLQHSIVFPALRILIGVGTRTDDVRTVPYDSGTTLLAQETKTRGKLPTTDSRYARVGLVLDTRDKEIGPHNGNWSELLVQRAGAVLGGDQIFTRITGTVRQYVPLGDDVTLAERVVAQTTRGDPAIGEVFAVQSSFRDDEILGGATSVRGIPKNRFVGKGVAFENSELRWSAARFKLLGRPTVAVLSGFVDAGRVWTDGLDASGVFEDLHVGYGGGLRLAIGPTFVVSGDVGHSSLSSAAVYIGVGYVY